MHMKPAAEKSFQFKTPDERAVRDATCVMLRKPETIGRFQAAMNIEALQIDHMMRSMLGVIRGLHADGIPATYDTIMMEFNEPDMAKLLKAIESYGRAMGITDELVDHVLGYFQRAVNVNASDIPPGHIGSAYSKALLLLAVKAERDGDSNFTDRLRLVSATCAARGNAEAFQRHFGLDGGPAEGTVDLNQTVHAISVMALAQILDANGEADKAELVRKANASCIASVARNIREGIAARNARSNVSHSTGSA